MTHGYLPARVLAAVFGVRLRTLQRWAAADDWRRIGSGPFVMYDVYDASAGVTRRAGRKR